jgi:hypothetical protein
MTLQDSCSPVVPAATVVTNHDGYYNLAKRESELTGQIPKKSRWD